MTDIENRMVARYPDPESDLLHVDDRDAELDEIERAEALVQTGINKGMGFEEAINDSLYDAFHSTVNKASFAKALFERDWKALEPMLDKWSDCFLHQAAGEMNNPTFNDLADIATPALGRRQAG